MFRFLNTYDLTINHVSQKRFTYFLVGYYKTKIFQGMRCKTYVCYSNPPEDEIYEKAGLPKARHILFSYNRNQLKRNEKNINGPKSLQGISGSGLWHLPISNIEKPSWKLVGIVTDLDKQFNVIIITKIGFVINAIKKYYDVV